MSLPACIARFSRMSWVKKEVSKTDCSSEPMQTPQVRNLLLTAVCQVLPTPQQCILRWVKPRGRTAAAPVVGAIGHGVGLGPWRNPDEATAIIRVPEVPGKYILKLESTKVACEVELRRCTGCGFSRVLAHGLSNRSFFLHTTCDGVYGFNSWFLFQAAAAATAKDPDAAK